jgi:glycerophosphoryl diester phosphodiesterase
MPHLTFTPPVIAHRGASAYAPENTMAAFHKAAQLNIKWVEFDVMLSRDEVPVIIHDETLERTTNGKGRVSDHTYAYLRTLDAGRWFHSAFSSERIPALMTVIPFLQEAKMCANIEIKAEPGQEEKLVQRVMQEMQPYLANNNKSFLFSSFSIEALHYLRKYSADCQIGLLLDEWRSDWKEICHSLNCAAIGINEEILTKDSAHEIKAMGKALLCYTVNNPARAKELYGWGVDAVFSDVPDRVG